MRLHKSQATPEATPPREIVGTPAMPGWSDRDTARFLIKIDASGDCWEWLASTLNSGYGQFRFKRRALVAHRIAWEMFVGPIPEGLQLDHLCRNRGCVNPDHLEPVTQIENIRRGEAAEVTRKRRAEQIACKRGHSLAREDVYINPKGERICRPCRAENNRRSYHRVKARKREDSE